MELDKPFAAKKSQAKRKCDGSPATKKSRTVKSLVMDEKIWKEFPNELLEEEVITRLPISTLFRFRAVCRKWNSLSESSTFLRRWDELASEKCPLFFAEIAIGRAKRHARMFAVYDPCFNKWHQPTIIPGNFKYAAASAGVLVCYADLTNTQFEIGNPLIRTRKVLRWSNTAIVNFSRLANDIAVGMVTTNQGYSARGSKVVWADALGNFEVYDCFTTKIETTGVIPANIKLPRGLMKRTVSINNVVYFLGLKPHGIISYDVVSGAWDQILISYPPNSSKFHLAECGGRILLVNYVQNKSPASISVGVWELKRPIVAWTEVDSMPSSWCSEFIGKIVRFDCFSNRRWLFITMSTLRFGRVFTYDLVSREWTKVPRCVPGDKGRQSVVRVTAFLPCFSASL